MLLNQSFRSSVILRRCFFKQSVQTLKSSALFSIRRKPVLLNKSEFKLLYSFPFIRVVAAITASGKTNLFLSAVTSPFSYYYFESVIPCLMLLGGACFHFAMVLGYSNAFKNVVGKIYVNKEGEVNDVIISSIDNSGRRIDRSHKANELINCEYYSKLTGQLGFIQISVENSDLHYKVNLRNCKICDPLIWENLFGRTSFPELVRKKLDKEIKMKEIK